ncbi:MAG: PAS domain-containing protein [Sphaerochaetaceae bacterium]|nr:PAS domain-containing protein [Sphaerochaetaceae bacterium]
MFELTTPGIIALFTAFIQISFAALLLSQKKGRGARELAFVMVSLFFYSFGAGLEHISRNPQMREVSIHLQYLGMPFLPYVLLRFITAYYRLRLVREHLYFTVYLSLGALFMTLQFTYPYHSLFYGERVYTTIRGFSAITMETYPFFFLHNLFHVITALVFIYYSLYMMLRGHKAYRKRGILLILAVLVPLLINIIYLTKAGESMIDPLPYALLVSTAIFIYLYFKDSLFGPIPIENRSILDSLMDGIIVLNGEGVVLEFNAKACEFLPVLNESHIGRSIGEVSHEVEELTALTDYSCSGTQNFGHEVSFPGSNGSARYLEVRQFYVEGRQKGTHVVTMVLRDVSERRRMIEELRLSYERIVEADRLKGLVIDVMSHNLRSPLQLMKSLRQLIASQEVSQNPAIWERGGQELDVLIQQADTLIANLLTLNISFDDEDAYQCTVVDIEAVVEQLRDKFQISASRKGVRYGSFLEGGVLVYGHEKLLSITLRNILDNALKYSFPGSEVSLHALVGQKEVKLVIENRGVSIDSEVLTAYEQGRWGITKRGTAGEVGPGIGLFASRRFMNLQDGSMHVQQREGGGTRVVLRLRRILGSSYVAPMELEPERRLRG